MLMRLLSSMPTVHTERPQPHLLTYAAGCAGVKNLLEDEAVQVGGSNHSHATQDLYDNIAQGNYPEWTLYIQTMDPAQVSRGPLLNVTIPHCTRSRQEAPRNGACLHAGPAPGLGTHPCRYLVAPAAHPVNKVEA